MMQSFLQGMPFPMAAMHGYYQLCQKASDGGCAQLNAIQSQVSWMEYRNAFNDWEKDLTSKMKASYPAWFEPASEWDAIP